MGSNYLSIVTDQKEQVAFVDLQNWHDPHVSFKQSLPYWQAKQAIETIEHFLHNPW